MKIRPILTAGTLATILAAATPLAAQELLTEFPRMPDGKPNFTGVWQAFGSAWDFC